MTRLRSEQIQRYQHCGYLFPLPALDAAEAAEMRSRFLGFYDAHREQLGRLTPKDSYQVLSETHVAYHWVYSLGAHPRVLDMVEGLLGPDLMIWGSRWFSKMPGDKTFVSWHQDGAYWGLHPPNVTTAWIALSDSVPENGCMRVVPGTHKLGSLSQIDTYDVNNALSRGQEIAVPVDEDRAVDVVLHPGEMSLHHIGVVHGSRVNTSSQPRIGIAFRYITPEVVQDGKNRSYAMLVRGRDAHGNFISIDPPREGRDDPAAQERVIQRMMNNLMPPKAG